MEKKPYIDPTLIAWLERYYPDRSPEPTWSKREIWIRRGGVDVIRLLKRLHEEQEDKLLS